MTRDGKTYLSALGMTCAAGPGPEAILANVLRGVSPGMVARDHWIPGQPHVVGEVAEPLPDLAAYPPELRSRNNALALRAAEQIAPEIRDVVARFGAHRVAVVVGTTTSGMAEAEAAFFARGEARRLPEGFRYALQELGAPAEFLAAAFGLKGAAFTVSTACSSSAKALAAGRRLLRIGACDAVLAGGVDTLCGFTLKGFQALGALSPEPTLPFSPRRQGINIGEAAAFLVMRRDRGPVLLLGSGETSDAYNISAPLPDGEGARQAMAQALREAKAEPGEVDYVNLHGTGTPQNDAMEARAMDSFFPRGVACSSTKPLTGHTLGAAGALEAGLCWALLAGLGGPSHALPPHLNGGVLDPELPPLDLVRPGRSLGRAPRLALSNVFGFGGTNVSLLLGAA